MSIDLTVLVENTGFIAEPDGSFSAFLSDQQRRELSGAVTAQMMLAAIKGYFEPRVGPVMVTWYDDFARCGLVVQVRPLNIERTQNLTGYGGDVVR